MPFDPEIPQPGDDLDADAVRAQLNGLKALIDAVPAGPEGPAGPPGGDGNEGAQGPPFAQAVVDGVSTLFPGQPATVDVNFDGTDVHFAFGIPEGQPGTEGPQGAPGEVSAAQLAGEIAGTALNPQSYGSFGGSFSEPPTAFELQALVDWIEGLRQALIRMP